MNLKFNAKCSLFLFTFLCFQHTVSAQVFSNEFHSENIGLDVDEKIEVAGPAGTNLSGWSIILYNGSGGAQYHTISLSGTLPNQCTVNGQNLGTLSFGPNITITAIQNGAPDGWALVNGSTVVEFLSYEGTFTATDGPAAGMTSIDIGASEDPNGAVTQSIQRTGASSWLTGNTNTMNSCNSTQYAPVSCVAPTFTACPSSTINANTSAGQCSATVNYTVTATGTPSPTLTYTFSGATTGSGTGTGSGSVFNKGNTTVTVTATNTCGAPTCTFTVTVTDNQVPTITCPLNIIINNTPGQCSATAVYTSPTGTDNCSGATTARTTGLASGATYPVGVTTNTFMVTASNGQTATCAFTVTVNDNQAPTITCPANVAINNDLNQCSAVVSFTPPTGSDNCPSVITIQTTGLASGAAFPVGVTTNTFRVTAANGQTATCAFTVTVTDNQAPTITCPANINLNNTANLCSAVANYTAPAGMDNCSGATTARTGGLNSGATYPVGTTTNTFTVTAANGQTASCSFTVTVTDNQPPVINCPVNIAVNNDVNQCSAVINYTAPTGTDNCSGATTAQTTGLASGAAFPIGVTTNTFVATAANGQTVSCTFTVTVTDNQAPSITCPGAIAVNNDVNQCSAVVNYNAPSGTDNCSGATTAQTTGLASGAAFPVGVTTNTFVVTAANGQTASCTFTVTVTDNEAPSITCPGAIAVNNDLNMCSAVVNYTAPTGTSLCGGVSTSQTTGLASGAAFPVGVTTNTFVATASNSQTASCTFTVTVTDNQAPSIICPGAVAVNNDVNLCSAVVNYTAPTGTDNCSGAATAQTTGLASGAAFPVGVTTNTFVVTAANGQTASCAITVTVTDNQAPVITCPQDITVDPDMGLCTASGVSLNSPSVVENCTLQSTTNDAPALYATGPNAVTWTATDVNGNTATCSHIVTVTACVLPTTISGNIRWEHNNAPVKDATVLLQNLPGLSSAGLFLTGTDGNYSFSPVSNGDYRIKPGKNINLLNGVNAADATRIQQHVTGNPLLSGPYKRIAADVNKSNTITTYDATLITQALAGNAAALLVFNTSWRFVPESYTFPNPNLPWGFPEKIDLTGVSSSVSNQNFIGIKIGDVNGTASPLLKPGRPVVVLVNDQITEQGKPVNITFTAGEFEDIAAFQFALGFDTEVLAFESVRSEGSIEMTDDNFGTFNTANGEFRAVWSAAQGRYLSQGAKLFTIRAKALQSGFKISELIHTDDQVLQGGAWNTALGKTTVELAFRDTQVSGTTGLPGDNEQLQLLQNRPNPFTSTTTIGFTLPQSCDAQLRIVDMNGRLIAETGKFYPAGYHQETIDLSGRTGLFYYELVTPMGVLSKKMSVTEK